MSVESETDKQCPNCKAWYAEYERMRSALVVSTAKLEALAERTKSLLDQLSSARAACGEAREAIIWMSGAAPFVEYPPWIKINGELLPKLRAIAEGKEATGG